MIKLDELFDVIDVLNANIYKYDDCPEKLFEVRFTDSQQAIMFADECLWTSEEEERGFNEEKDEYEPLLPFIKKQFNKYVEKLEKLKF